MKRDTMKLLNACKIRTIATNCALMQQKTKVGAEGLEPPTNEL